MFQHVYAGNTAVSLSLLCGLTLLAIPPAMAAGRTTVSRTAQAADPAVDFRTLAQQRPRACADDTASATPPAGWTAGVTECTWQYRLRMRRWNASGGAAPGTCVSAPAQWWSWIRATNPGLALPAWHGSWTSQSVVDDAGPEKRIVIMQRQASGEWRVTEWRWNPSERAATRRWQEGRWQLLAARAEQLRAPAEARQGAAQAHMLRSVLEAHLANRVSEIGEQTWQWQAEGQCLQVDAVGLGQQIMQLPYVADDSRSEQRAAMQLQLARRYPKATWLNDFSLVPAAARARGGAKFYAVWTDNQVLKGQLWIPTRNGGPLVRLRITTPMSARAQQVVQRELTGLASRWAAMYE